ncbi:MAG: glycosyl transferase family 2 [Lawsonibacter sp.]|nr:glycosyl transferase family 2 [Lawsonibacter sp.]
MEKYCVCVYAICKNKETFVDRWMDSMSEADRIVVLDTGSTDATVERLRARGAEVEIETIDPWRFDVARNRSMELVPRDVDICVCTDLDEVFHRGWRELLEETWVPGAGQATYRYTGSFTPDGAEGVVFWYEKIHARKGYQWVHPVHEVLAWIGEGKCGPMVVAEGVQLDHHPDPTKSRGQYLPLLELSVAEDPEDDRSVHYLGLEYLYRGRWDDCIRTLKTHLEMPKATWRDERAASMRYIARAYLQKGEPGFAQNWYFRAIAEAPHLREPYIDLANLLYSQENWEGVLYVTGCALEIVQRPRSYICEAEPWGSLPHALRTIAFSRTGRNQEALEEARLALALEPGNERLQENMTALERLEKGQ